MPSIFPEPLAGGIVIRDAGGVALNPANVERAYSPLPAFVSSCLITALPSDCTARIESKQINAIVSELVSFAECLDPNGPWDCNSPKNLCSAFSTWFTEYAVSLAVVVDGVSIVGAGTVADPFEVGTVDCGSY